MTEVHLLQKLCQYTLSSIFFFWFPVWTLVVWTEEHKKFTTVLISSFYEWSSAEHNGNSLLNSSRKIVFHIFWPIFRKKKQGLQISVHKRQTCTWKLVWWWDLLQSQRSGRAEEAVLSHRGLGDPWEEVFLQYAYHFIWNLPCTSVHMHITHWILFAWCPLVYSFRIHVSINHQVDVSCFLQWGDSAHCI